MIANDARKSGVLSQLIRNRNDTGQQVVSSLRYDWVMAILTAWLVVGIHVDGWAHQHIPELESFFTPWHALFYSAFGFISIFLSITLYANHRQGFGWSKALPSGYELSFMGVLTFLVGGVGDMIWHTLLGIESNVEALLSPTHLMLASGALLIASGPLRSAWLRLKSQGQSLLTLFPMLLSATMMLSMLTFFTQYAHDFGDTWAATAFQSFSNNQNFNQSLATVSIMFQTAIWIGLVLLLVRRWALPFGSLTLLTGLNLFLLSFMRDRTLTTGVLPLVVVALVAGLSADGLIQLLKPSGSNRRNFRVFAFITPLVLYSLYFGAIVLTGGGIWWTVPLWAGSIFLAGIAGWLTSFLVLPPVMPFENGLENTGN